ncbi:hypothetical protein Ancab_004336 [Ancistrocladus abbreviatus]
MIIEYLNVVTILVMLVCVINAVENGRRLDFGKMWERIKPLKELLDFISNFPKWLNYYNDLQDNVQLLKQKRVSLCCKEEDIKGRVENQERITGRPVKNEVSNWLSNVRHKDDEVKRILEKGTRQMNCLFQFIYHAWLGNSVERKIKDVVELWKLGESISAMDSMVSDAEQSRELIPIELIGASTLSHLEKIWEWSICDESSRILGVHGVEGCGKTAIMTVIYNRLIKEFKKVYIVFVRGNVNLEKLQNDIARELHIDLQDKDEWRRAARLADALSKQKKFILILDGLSLDFYLRDIGIPINLSGSSYQSQGKLIITSQSERVCQKMGCRPIISLEHLSECEAEELFAKELKRNPNSSLLPPDIEHIKMRIIKKCQNIPGKIKTTARDLRGEDDYHVWVTKLSQM